MKSDGLGPSVRVLVTPPDRSEHSRTPGYTGNRIGIITERCGDHPLPASVVRGERPPRSEGLFSVEFQASDLFGTGDHRVHVDLYASALRISSVG